LDIVKGSFFARMLLFAYMRDNKSLKHNNPQPDGRYHSLLVSRLINQIMVDGKKSIAVSIVYKALDALAIEDASGDMKEKRRLTLEKFERAIKNVTPEQEVRSRRVGGATYQVPVPIRHSRAESLALRWLINSARSRSGKPMPTLLTEEITNAYNESGPAFKKKEDMHRMAQANRAFAHFSWAARN